MVKLLSRGLSYGEIARSPSLKVVLASSTTIS